MHASFLSMPSFFAILLRIYFSFSDFCRRFNTPPIIPLNTIEPTLSILIYIKQEAKLPNFYINQGRQKYLITLAFCSPKILITLPIIHFFKMSNTVSHHFAIHLPGDGGLTNSVFVRVLARKTTSFRNLAHFAKK